MSNNASASSSTGRTSANSPPDFWHAYLKSAGGYSVALVSTNGLLAVFCAVGIVLNAMLVVVTKRNTNLHGRCNLLLAFNSLTVCGILFGQTYAFFVVLFGINFIPLLSCYALLCIPLVGAALATSAQLCIGLDRLLSVLFPIWYTNSDKFKSFYVLLTFCVVRTFYLNAAYLSSVIRRSAAQVMCSPGDIVGPDIGAFIYQEGLVLFCSEFACYALIWLVIWCRKSEDVKNMKKLMKSLTAIMCTSFFCYIQGNLWRVILPYVNFGPWEIQFYVGFPTTVLYTIAFSSNTPILYMFSTEYRAAFRATFGPKDSSRWAQPAQNNVTRSHQQHTNTNRINQSNDRH